MKEYKDLSDATKKRLALFLESIHKKGFTISQLNKMTDVQFAFNLGIKNNKRKKQNIQSNRRLLRQCKATKERRINTKDLALNSYKKFGFSGAGLKQIESGLIKALGSTFESITDDLQKTVYKNVKNPKLRERRANRRAQDLLLIPKQLRPKLGKVERDILDFWSP